MIYRDPGLPPVIRRAGEILDFGPWAKVSFIMQTTNRLMPDGVDPGQSGRSAVTSPAIPLSSPYRRAS
jgi:hypothetical protein